MEFYALPCGLKHPGDAGFNSQRDGILRGIILKPRGDKLPFQFPTGWNSTDIVSDEARQICVSIPNGMEFYRLLVALVAVGMEFQFPTGWNSTIFALHSLRFAAVSIPNGMEFYCFGSASLLWAARVSIPNGMEFYPAARSILCR